MPTPRKQKAAKPKAPKATLPRSIVNTVPSSIKLAKACDQMALLITQVADEAMKQTRKGPVEAAKAFVVLHRLDEKVTQVEKMYGAFFNTVKTSVLPERFEQAEVPFVPLAEGFRVSVSNPLRASIRGGMKEEAIKWLEENGLGDLVGSTVNASTLSAAISHMIQEDNKDPPDRIFSVEYVPSTSVTATKR